MKYHASERVVLAVHASVEHITNLPCSALFCLYSTTTAAAVLRRIQRWTGRDMDAYGGLPSQRGCEDTEDALLVVIKFVLLPRVESLGRGAEGTFENGDNFSN